MTGPSLVDAAAGDPRASSCHDPDIDARITCQPFFPEREAVVVALASRAQETRHKHHGLLGMRKGKEKDRKTHE